MKKQNPFFTILFVYILSLSHNSLAQTLQLLPIPSNGKDYGGFPIVFNGKLYFNYTDTRDITSLGKFDGTTISLVPNPTQVLAYDCKEAIVFNNALYGTVKTTDNSLMLSKFDGTTVSIILKPDTASHYSGRPIIFNNALYFGYSDKKFFEHLAKYDGTSITLIPNPHPTGQYEGNPVVFNNTLYFSYSYTDSNNSKAFYLAKFDGNKVVIINNPDIGRGINRSFNNPHTIFNNALYCFYEDKSSLNRLAKFDGSSLSIIANPDTLPLGSNYGYQGYPIVFKNALYFLYQDKRSVYRLGKYDGTNSTLITSPDNGAYGEHPIIFNNSLFHRYVGGGQFLGYRLSKFDGTSSSIVPNPNGIFLQSNRGYLGYPIVYNNALYGKFNESKYTLVKYDGTSSNPTLITHPDTGLGVYTDYNISNLIVFNEALYTMYWDANGRSRLAFLKTQPTNLSENASLNVSISPNPSLNKITCVFPNVTSALIEVFDLTGQRVIFQKVDALETDIDISKLYQGLYLISVQSGNKIFKSKIVKI
jgi:hypothetical protein